MTNKPWQERFDEKFCVANPITEYDPPRYFLRDNCSTSELKSFISELSKEQFTAGYKAGREDCVAKIEDYFRGLIHIPFPEKTKENLINLINKDERSDNPLVQ